MALGFELAEGAVPGFADGWGEFFDVVFAGDADDSGPVGTVDEAGVLAAAVGGEVGVLHPLGRGLSDDSDRCTCSVSESC